jgi:LPXTG-motif cell wall-anchored protein
VTKPVESASAPEVKEMQEQTVTAVTPEGKAVDLAQAVQSEPNSAQPQSQAQQQTERGTEVAQPNAAPPSQLPKTASHYPAIGLLGIGALVAGSAVRLLAKRTR